MELRILPNPSQKFAIIGAFYYRKLDPPIVQSIPAMFKLENTTPINGFANQKLRISILLARKDSETLTLYLTSVKSARNVKRCYIKVGSTEINSKHILKLSGFGKFVFFHESLNTIQLRSLISLKIIKEISILTIQEALSNTNQGSTFSKSSLDVDYISSRDEFILCWGQTISTVDRNEKVTLIYDGESQATKERFHTISFNELANSVLVIGVLSYVLITYDNKAESWHTRKLTHPAISRSCRYLNWEPTQQLMFVLQAGVRNKENVLILSYREENKDFKLKASILSVVMSSANYSAHTKKLIYVIVDTLNDKRKVMELNISNCLENTDDNNESEEELVVIGNYLTDVPERSSRNVQFSYFFNNILVGRPILHNS